MKYYGKEKCRILKEIRAEIARANDIEWVVSECKHKGNCKGTCPKCEHCRAVLRLPKKPGKHTVRCPQCNKTFSVKI